VSPSKDSQSPGLHTAQSHVPDILEIEGQNAELRHEGCGEVGSQDKQTDSGSRSCAGWASHTTHRGAHRVPSKDLFAGQQIRLQRQATEKTTHRARWGGRVC
jgi:hypothetical protein